MPNRSLRTATTKFACSRPTRVAQAERHDGQALELGVAEDLDLRVGRPRAQRAPGEVVLAPADLVGADGVLEREGEARAHGLHDGGRAALLADRRVGVVGVPGRADEEDRPAAGDRGHAVAHEPALGHEHARRAGAADELVRRDEDRVLVGERPVRDVRRRVHVDRQVRAGGGVVPARLRAVAVQRDRDLVDVGHDAGDVRRGREAADLHPAVGVAAQLVLEVLDVDAALVVLADGDDVGRPTRARAARWSGARRAR